MPRSGLSKCKRLRTLSPFLGSDLRLGSNLNPNITSIRTYTRAHFRYYAGCRRVGGVRPTRLRFRAP